MRRTIVTSGLAGLLTLAVCFAIASAKSPEQSKSKAAKSGKMEAAGRGNADSINIDELKIYDYFLASDQLEGRNMPSRGYDTAALYVASHLAEWGLKPGGSTSGTNGPLQPYLMPFELVTRSVIPEEAKASITAPPPAGRGGVAPPAAGARGGSAPMRTTDFEYAKDWTVTAGGRGAPPLKAFDASGNLVFAGNGYVVNKTNTNPYQGLDVSGKISSSPDCLPKSPRCKPPVDVVARARQNPLGENCTDYLTPEEYAAKNGALAVVTVASYQQLSAMANPNGGRGGRRRLNGPPYQVVKFGQRPLAPARRPFTAGLELTNAIFQGEKLSAADAFYNAGENTKLDSFAMNASKTLNLHVPVQSGEATAKMSSAFSKAAIPSSRTNTSSSARTWITSVSARRMADGHNVNNGADDDGSGSTGLLAIAHVICRGRGEGHASASAHSSSCGTAARKKVCGVRNTSPNFRPWTSPRWSPTSTWT